MRKALIVSILGLLIPAGACAPAGSGSPTAPAIVVVTDNAHLDVLSVGLQSGNFSLGVDHADSAQLLDPSNTVIHVRPSSQGIIGSNPLFSFLGPAGSPVWQLDGGWSIHDVLPGQLVNDSVQLRLISFSGPGNMAVWKFNSFSQPSADLATSATLPQVLNVSYDAHAHRTWSFTATGTYTAQFDATATLQLTGQPVSSGPKSFTFVVGPYPPT